MIFRDRRHHHPPRARRPRDGCARFTTGGGGQRIVRARIHGDGDPVGGRFKVAFQMRTIVGVVRDIKVRGLERVSEPQVYLPYGQVPDGAMTFYAPKDLIVRASGDPLALVPAVRGVIGRADPRQPLSEIRLLSEIVDAETAPRVVQVRLLGAFAAIAFLLAGIGIHGLLAFAVSARAREIGVRMAFGARASDILGMVVRRGLLLAVAGILIGVPLAYAAARTMEAILAGIGAGDTITFLAATGLCLCMTVAGTIVPHSAPPCRPDRRHWYRVAISRQLSAISTHLRSPAG